MQLQKDLRGNFNKIAIYQFSVFTNCKNGHWKNQDFNLILLKLEKIATIDCYKNRFFVKFADSYLISYNFCKITNSAKIVGLQR
nr:MAG TPA: hypothetical protein [Caudoviricetes sp.]